MVSRQVGKALFSIIKPEEMNYLSKDIERLLKKKNMESLVRKQYSCGIFQEYDAGYPADHGQDRPQV